MLRKILAAAGFLLFFVFRHHLTFAAKRPRSRHVSFVPWSYQEPLFVFRNKNNRHLALLSVCCYFPANERASTNFVDGRELGSFPGAFPKVFLNASLLPFELDQAYRKEIYVYSEKTSSYCRQ